LENGANNYWNSMSQRISSITGVVVVEFLTSWGSKHVWRAPSSAGYRHLLINEGLYDWLKLARLGVRGEAWLVSSDLVVPLDEEAQAVQ
jgi:hypothetical protein